MMFHEREYDLYVMLGHRDGDKPWVASSWARISAALNPLVATARDRAAVRTTQWEPKPASSYFRPRSFGRLAWNEKSASKWVHASDGLLQSGEISAFQLCDLWAPSWSTCGRDNRPPDAFFSMGNESDRISGAVAQSFSSTCILAVASDSASADNDGAVEAAKAIADVTSSVLRAYCHRPWGIAFGASTYTDSIQDLGLTGLFKPGPYQTWPLSLDILKGTWTAF